MVAACYLLPACPIVSTPLSPPTALLLGAHVKQCLHLISQSLCLDGLVLQWDCMKWTLFVLDCVSAEKPGLAMWISVFTPAPCSCSLVVFLWENKGAMEQWGHETEALALPIRYSHWQIAQIGEHSNIVRQTRHLEIGNNANIRILVELSSKTHMTAKSQLWSWNPHGNYLGLIFDICMRIAGI